MIARALVVTAAVAIVTLGRANAVTIVAHAVIVANAATIVANVVMPLPARIDRIEDRGAQRIVVRAIAVSKVIVVSKPIAGIALDEERAVNALGAATGDNRGPATRRRLTTPLPTVLLLVPDLKKRRLDQTLLELPSEVAGKDVEPKDAESRSSRMEVALYREKGARNDSE